MTIRFGTIRAIIVVLVVGLLIGMSSFGCAGVQDDPQPTEPVAQGAANNPNGATGELVKVKVRLMGSPPVPNYAIERYIDEKGLFKAYAKEYGYDVESERHEFNSGVAALEALQSGQLEQALVGQMPALNIVAKGLPVYLGSGVAGGHNGHSIVVRPDSDIGSLDDLVARKSTVGTVIGSTAYQFLEGAFEAAYGKSAEEMGIEVIDLPPGQGAALPKGVDAVCYWSYTPQAMVSKGVGEVLLNDWGYTGPAWTAEPGPGKQVPFLENSIFYPEGFAPYRNFCVWNKQFVDDHPKLVVAYNLAFAEAVQALQQDRPEAQEIAWNYVKDKWGIPKEDALDILASDLSIGVRGWSFLTYGDAKAIVWSAPWSFKNGYIKNAVTWEDAKAYFEATAPLEKEAWEKLGETPTVEEMTKESGTDVRGLPLWMMDEWPDEDPPTR